MLVDANRAHVEDARDAQHKQTTALLRSIETRLEAIEARLGTPSDT
jgi:hypothetical protein